MKIYYDSINQSLINYDTDEILYRECHDSEIDLVDVIAGEVTWDNGDLFTLEDFIRECLEINDFKIVDEGEIIMTTHQKLQKAGFMLQNSGGVWQYRSKYESIATNLSNSYSMMEAIEYINNNFVFKDGNLKEKS